MIRLVVTGTDTGIGKTVLDGLASSKEAFNQSGGAQSKFARNHRSASSMEMSRLTA